VKRKNFDVTHRVRWRRTFSADPPALTRLTRTLSFRDVSEPACAIDLSAGWEGEGDTTTTFTQAER